MIQLSEAAQLYNEDCREAIKRIPDNSIDSCVTDPPYALVSTLKRFANSPRTEASMPTSGPHARASRGFMGQTWDTGETAFSIEFWAEVYRVLKPGAFVAAFGASRGYHRMACAIEDAGFEIRDSLMWIYGTGFPKSHDVSKGIDRLNGDERPVVGERNKTQSYGANEVYGDGPDKGGVQVITSAASAAWEGWGTALKPAFEPIVLARKPLSEPTVAANVLRWRTGAINIDGCRVPTDETITATRNIALGSSSGGVYSAATQPGVYVQKDGGRFPANVITDGSDEVVGMFPNTQPSKRKSGDAEQYRANNKNAVYGAGMEAAAHAGHDDHGNGSAARFFYSAKASKADRNGSKHPTVKPIALMEWLATLVTPHSGTILDPFAGSGTTGAAARNKGFNIVMCERESEYAADIKARFGFIESPPLAPPPY